MFSEYASKFLSHSHRPAPLFEAPIAASDSDTEAFLGWVGESLASSSLSDQTEDDPPDDIAIEQPSPHAATRGHDTSLPRRPWREPPRWWDDAHRTKTTPDKPNGLQEGVGSTVQGGTGPPLADPGPRHTDDTPVSGRPASVLPGPLVFDNMSLESTATTLYIVSLATSLTAAILVLFSTAPSSNGISLVFSRSMRNLAIFSVVSVCSGRVWVAALVSKPRAVVQVTSVIAPGVIGAIGILALLLSFHSSNSHGYAHTALRLIALVPVAGSIAWVYCLRRSKEAFGRATEMIVLATEVVKACPQVLHITVLSCLAALVLAGLWVIFLSHAVLEGTFSLFFVLWFTFTYLWTWGVVCVIQKCIVTAVGATWYRKRPEVRPNISLQAGVAETASLLSGATVEVLTERLGTCCLSSLITLLTRIPLLVLPTAVGVLVQAAVEHVASSTALSFLDPLTVPTAVVGRMSLQQAAQTVSSESFITTDRAAYRMSKMILGAARLTCSCAMGFFAWVHIDRSNTVASAYGYIIAIVAFCIGWTVVGAADDTLGMLIDSLYVCHLLEILPKNPETERVFGNLSV